MSAEPRWERATAKRRSPRMTAIIQGPDSEISSSANNYSQAGSFHQVAFLLDRRADAELSVGRTVIAERLAHQAQQLLEWAV